MKQKIINKIAQIIRYFETSKVSGADYGAISTFHDGPNKRLQISYGMAQTTEYGNLPALIKMYIDAKGSYAGAFIPYLSKLGNLKLPSLAEDTTFVQLLKRSAQDPIMQDTQNKFFNKYYLQPAQNWFTANGFTLPLSLLVIYDSFVHSGSIMDFLRNRFPAKLPVAGGSEKEWITEYVQVRDAWLGTNTNRPILRNTDYRTDSFIYAIRDNNWMLDKPFKVVNYPDLQNKVTPRIEAVIP